MRTPVFALALCSLLSLPAVCPHAQAAAPKNAPGTLVIVFKDGHRQTFNLADIARVEFPAGGAIAESAPSSPQAPARGRFFGKWEVGTGNGDTFIITLHENGDAYRTLGDVHGKWEYVNGEADIIWDDGSRDAIRRVGSGFQKFWYDHGKPFTSTPDNVTEAHNTSPRPI